MIVIIFVDCDGFLAFNDSTDSISLWRLGMVLFGNDSPFSSDLPGPRIP